MYYTLCNSRGGHGVFTDRLRLVDIDLLPYYVEIQGDRAATSTFCPGSQLSILMVREDGARELWEWPCPNVRSFIVAVLSITCVAVPSTGHAVPLAKSSTPAAQAGLVIFLLCCCATVPGTTSFFE